MSLGLAAQFAIKMKPRHPRVRTLLMSHALPTLDSGRRRANFAAMSPGNSREDSLAPKMLTNVNIPARVAPSVLRKKPNEIAPVRLAIPYNPASEA
jgi:hypothetical protein